MAFATKELIDLMDIKIFVDTDADIRLARRLRRDIVERGRSIDSVLAQYNKYVKPSFEYYIAPTMPSADIIVPRGGDNEIAIDLIVKHVNRELYHVIINIYFKRLISVAIFFISSFKTERLQFKI